MIREKTQLEKDLDAIDKRAESTLRALKAAVITLNNSFDALWNLPDNRLVAVLQHLLDNNLLNDIFNRHHNVATSLNNILIQNACEDIKAVDVIKKEIVIDETGKLSIIYREVIDPIIEE